MRSWYAIRALSEGAEVSIYDEIGAYGVSAKSFLAELCALPDAVPLALRLNSPGGSVFDAVAIYNALKRHAGPVTVWIDGIAASAASYIAMAGDEVVMPGNAFLMIHDPSGMVLGTAADMRAMAEALDKIKGSLVAGYVAKSGGDEADIAALMAKETWLDAEEAVGLGFADRMTEPVRIAARFDIGRFRNAPPVLVEAVESAADNGEDGPPDDHDAVAEAEGSEADQAEDEHDFVRADPPSDADIPAGTDGSAATKTLTDPDPPAEQLARIDPASIRAEAMAHARAVVDLCRLAGQPQVAGRFLERDTSLDDVRAALLAARADAAPDISAAHPQPGRPSGARPWGDVIARTFKRKG